MLVAIAGHIGAGKDTLAHWFVRERGFQRIGFADCLKDEVATLLRRTLEAYLVERGVGPDMDKAIHDVLWTRRTPVTRALLQEFGTEVRRRSDPDYWVDRWAEQVSRLDNVVCPDARFLNECRRVRELNGYLIRVERPGHNGDSHESENGLNDWTDYDLIVQNTGSITDLERQVEAWWRGVHCAQPQGG